MKGSLNMGTSWPFLRLHPFPLIAECTALLTETKVPWQERGITQARALNAESCDAALHLTPTPSTSARGTSAGLTGQPQHAQQIPCATVQLG